MKAFFLAVHRYGNMGTETGLPLTLGKLPSVGLQNLKKIIKKVIKKDCFIKELPVDYRQTGFTNSEKDSSSWGQLVTLNGFQVAY